MARTSEEFESVMNDIRDRLNICKPQIASLKSKVMNSVKEKVDLEAFALLSKAELSRAQKKIDVSLPSLTLEHGKKLTLTIMKSANSYLDPFNVSNAMR